MTSAAPVDTMGNMSTIPWSLADGALRIGDDDLVIYAPDDDGDLEFHDGGPGAYYFPADGLLALLAPPRPWHYVADPSDLERIGLGVEMEVAAYTRDTEPRGRRLHIGAWVPGLGLKISTQGHVPAAAIYAYRPAEAPPEPLPLPEDASDPDPLFYNHDSGEMER